MVSMKEIAKQCNVSVATVSKALNGYSDIGEETKNYIVWFLKNENNCNYSVPHSQNDSLGVIFLNSCNQ